MVAAPLAETSARAFRVGGVVAFSTADWPGRLSAVVFAQGCPWQCAYCHNPHLNPVQGEDPRDFARVLEWLRTRRGLIDAVVFSGGEPTAQPALASALAEVRALGFATAIHTGGMYPRRLPQILSRCDWIGFDVKAPQDEYPEITGVPRSGLAAFVSLAIALQSGVPCEVRTTVHPTLTPRDRLERLAVELANAGVKRWVLQPFRPMGCADPAVVDAAVSAPSVIDDALVARLSTVVPETVVRA
jgi:pyruvate formate lyase activating enzyme